MSPSVTVPTTSPGSRVTKVMPCPPRSIAAIASRSEALVETCSRAISELELVGVIRECVESTRGTACFPECRIVSPDFVVTALRDDATLLELKHLVAALNRRQAVGDHEDREVAVQ
jgi:hypothetical protein